MNTLKFETHWNITKDYRALVSFYQSLRDIIVHVSLAKYEQIFDAIHSC